MTREICATGHKPISEAARMTAAMRRKPPRELARQIPPLLHWGARPPDSVPRQTERATIGEPRNAVRLLHHAGASDAPELDRNAQGGPAGDHPGRQARIL